VNKPDWKDAPEWANYLAMDRDGLWAWHENKPITEKGVSVWMSSDFGKVVVAYKPEHHWRETLEERPNA
jgi:hypothetical protein